MFLNVDENQEKLTFFYKNIDKICVNSIFFSYLCTRKVMRDI